MKTKLTVCGRVALSSLFGLTTACNNASFGPGGADSTVGGGEDSSSPSSDTMAAETNGNESAADSDASSDGEESGGDPPSCPPPEGMPVEDGLEHLGKGQWGQSGNFIEILDVVADGTFVYACTGTQGMMIWDATADGPPTLGTQLIGGPFGHPSFPRCQHIGEDWINDRVVITSHGDEVQPTPFMSLFDVSNPASPHELRSWQGAESIEGVVLRGDRIYAAAHTDGIVVFDAGSGSSLTQVGSFSDTYSDTWLPKLVGDTLVVAEGSTGIRLYDVSSDSPQLISTLALEGSSRDVVVEDGLAYLASSSHLNIVDISDPTTPSLISSTETVGTALALARGQNHSVVIAEWDQVRVYDIGDPSNPVLVGSQLVPTTSAFSRVLALDAVPGPEGGSGRVYPGEWEGLHAYRQQGCDYGPDISVSPGSLAFGNLGPGESKQLVLVVRNDGNQELVVSSLAGSTAAITASSSGFGLAPGQAKAVEVTLSSTSTSQLSGSLVLSSNDIDETSISVSATANVSGLSVGDPVPNFNLVDIEGQSWSTSSLAGKVTLLAYFATF